jgi:hypothetical protein
MPYNKSSSPFACAFFAPLLIAVTTLPLVSLAQQNASPPWPQVPLASCPAIVPPRDLESNLVQVCVANSPTLTLFSVALSCRTVRSNRGAALVSVQMQTRPYPDLRGGCLAFARRVPAKVPARQF